MSATEPVLVIGVGNRMRGDDGAGPAVLDRLGEMQMADVEMIEVATDCAGLIDMWRGRADVIVVDATQSGAEPGEIVTIDALAQPIERDLFIHTSHVFGVAEAVETARMIDALPGRLTVYGIEGAAFGLGDGLTPSVAESAKRVAAMIGGSNRVPLKSD